MSAVIYTTRLTKDECIRRIQLVEDLWDSIAEDSAGIQLSGAQREELDRRTDGFDSNPSAGAPWEEFKSTIQRKP